MNPLTRLPKIPSAQITPLVAELPGTIQLQMEEIQLLKDEIARLKGQKPKPKIKPSNLGIAGTPRERGCSAYSGESGQHKAPLTDMKRLCAVFKTINGRIIRQDEQDFSPAMMRFAHECALVFNLR